VERPAIKVSAEEKSCRKGKRKNLTKTRRSSWGNRIKHLSPKASERKRGTPKKTEEKKGSISYRGSPFITGNYLLKWSWGWNILYYSR